MRSQLILANENRLLPGNTKINFGLGEQVAVGSKYRQLGIDSRDDDPDVFPQCQSQQGRNESRVLARRNLPRTVGQVDRGGVQGIVDCTNRSLNAIVPQGV